MSTTRTAAALAAGVFALALAACTPETPTAPQEIEYSPEQAFIADLDARGVGYASADDAIIAGRATCSFLDGGNSIEALFLEMAQNGPDAPEVADGVPNESLPVVIGVAVRNLCPDHLDTLAEDLGA